MTNEREKYWVQAEMRDGRVIGYGVYRMADIFYWTVPYRKPECYESFADQGEAQEYCDERNDERNNPWWPSEVTR